MNLKNGIILSLATASLMFAIEGYAQNKHRVENNRNTHIEQQTHPDRKYKNRQKNDNRQVVNKKSEKGKVQHRPVHNQTFILNKDKQTDFNKKRVPNNNGNKAIRPGNKQNNNKNHSGHNKGDNKKKNHGYQPNKGHYNHGVRPHYNYRQQGYRPPHHNGGYWGHPKFNKHYWSCPLPPPPHRPAHYRTGLPILNTILGITFGSFIDYGINQLYMSGYNVGGYIDNSIYLTDVTQFGVKWPSVTVFYNDGLMNGVDFQYYDKRHNMTCFNKMYAYFTNTYGLPVQENSANMYNRSASWWDGSRKVYITAQYCFGKTPAGGGYYTNIVLGI